MDGADGDCGIECAGAEGDSLADVREEEIARDVALEGDVEHGGGDVEADPCVGPAGGGRDGGEDFARQAGAAAYVEDEGGGREVEEGEGAMGHAGLNGLDAGGSGVFEGGRVVVEEVGWARNCQSAHSSRNIGEAFC